MYINHIPYTMYHIDIYIYIYRYIYRYSVTDIYIWVYRCIDFKICRLISEKLPDSMSEDMPQKLSD